MLRFTDYDIVFQEIPDETTLAINLSGCPNRCKGCHSPQLMEDIGEELTENALDGILARYAGAVTCVCFMGGDGDAASVDRLAQHVRSLHKRTGWYSGRATLPEGFVAAHFDYVKTGPYIEALGPLSSPTTNQRLYRIEQGALIDITARMRKPVNM